MIAYRLATRATWLKIDPKTGSVKARPGRAEEATVFDSEEAAQAALSKAIAMAEAKFAKCFPEGSAPVRPASVRAPAALRMPRPALEAIKFVSSIADAQVEAFEMAPPLSERMALAPLHVIVSEQGTFLRQGATGYCSFMECLEGATFFPSAEEAQAFFQDCAVRSADQALIANARIASLGLSLHASLRPDTLAPSENDATAMMRSLRERGDIEGQSVKAPPGARPKAL